MLLKIEYPKELLFWVNLLILTVLEIKTGLLYAIAKPLHINIDNIVL
jgi:hypothetical protein